jgi:SAM-dependent methyltransferase
MFGGGKLVRYRCTNCEAIFGPLKMLKLSAAELAADYRLHYSCFDEGTTTEAEMEAFQALAPLQGGCYLNYGSGRWSDSIRQARALGFDVYGFEPYAPPADRYVISSLEALQELRFDGIMSHNLLEHLPDPAAAMTLMRSLLKPGGMMAHSTACYEYRFEVSRFHLVFFTGKAVDAVCCRSRLDWSATANPSIRLFRPIDDLAGCGKTG